MAVLSKGEWKKWRASRGGRASANSPKRQYPLRKIVDEWWVAGGLLKREKLECGHINNAPSDIAGFTNAARRRCYKCHHGLPEDQD